MRRHLLAPVLLAVYPVLMLEAIHLDRVPVRVVVGPLVVILGLVFLLDRALELGGAGASRRSLMLSLAMVMFFSFHVQVGLGQRLGLRVRHVLLLHAAGLGVGWFFTRVRSMDRLRRWVEGFALLCLLGPASFAVLSLEEGRQPPRTAVIPVPAPVQTPASRPDVYFILLDGYARGDVLEALYSLDNEPFLGALRSLGFHVDEEAWANYGRTAPSLHSTLNMTYLDEIVSHMDEDASSEAPLVRGVRRSVVGEIFRDLGYRRLVYDSGVEVTRWMSQEDFLAPPGSIGPFAEALLRQTPLPHVFLYLDRVLGGTPLSPHARHLQRVRFLLDVLGEEKGPGPRFVLAHLLMPHPPLLVDSDGNLLPPPGSFSLASGMEYMAQKGWDRETFRERYRWQIEYLNEHLLPAVERIRKRSPDAVIIIQSDHGPSSGTDLSDLDPADPWERLAILSAISVPGLDAAPRRSTPVNTFRFLFTHLFGLDLPPLEDRCHMVPMGRPYDHVLIPLEQLRGTRGTRAPRRDE